MLFVVRRGILQPASLLVALVCFGGCSSQPRSQATEDSVTSGRIRIVCAAEAYGLVVREAEAFQALYPEGRLEAVSGSSRDAIRALFAAQCDVAVISRELEPEERRAAVQGGLELEGYRFARNAVLLVVHPSNPVENVALDDVRRIYRGDPATWNDMGGRGGAVAPVVQEGTSDVTEFFVEEALGGEPVRARSIVARSDSEVVAVVARRPDALGYISLGTDAKGVKVLRVASLRGLPYWKPDLEAIYRGEYPLTRFFNLYVRARGARLASGFVTFVTSMDGQRLVREAGLVPTSVPVRFVRRSPMLSTHSRGDSVRIP
jgi:phosphate transport system substrate-binding protein